MTADSDCSREVKRHSLEGKYGQPRQHIKKTETLLCYQMSI